MDRVLDRLWIGCSRDLLAGSTLRAMGFGAVLDLRDRVAPGEGVGESLHSLRFDNLDGQPWKPEDIEKAYEFIHLHIRSGRVLVICVAGMSRSASIVIGYLVRCGWDVPTAFGAVSIARPTISPSPGMLEAALLVATNVSGVGV